VEVLEKVRQPLQFENSSRHAAVLSLSRGLGHGFLLLGLPRNERGTKKDAEACERTSRIATAALISITESLQLKIRRNRIEEAMMCCTLQVA